MKALIVKGFWLNKIFNENKIWEMRTTKTNIRGVIGLIESGTGLIVGETKLIGCSDSPISKSKELIKYHKVEDLELLNKWKYAWYFQNTKKYNKPIPYKHPQGAVVWVNVTL